MKRSTQIFIVCTAFLAGISLVATWPVLQFGLIVIGIGSLLILYKPFRFVAIVIVALGLGLWRYEFTIPVINESHIAFYADKRLKLRGTVLAEVEKRIDGQRLTIGNLELNNNKLDGKLLVKVYAYPKHEYGEELSVNCLIRKPEPFDSFAYDKYLERYGIYATCYRAQINVLSHKNGNFVLRNVLKFKDKLEHQVRLMMSEPYASFLAGLLWGSRSGLPADLLSAFSTTGVTHIIAISGYNITVISVILGQMLIRLGVSRKKALPGLLIGITLFVIFTGMSASVVRAGIMGMLVLLIQGLGRLSNPKGLLAMTAALMIAINPRILLDDAGFQLSFLATIGLVYLTEWVEGFANWMTEKFSIRESLVSTLAATVATTPLITWQFGKLSLVAPLVNLLILPVLPWIMLIGAISLGLSFIWLPLGQVISWFAWGSLRYVIFCVELFAKLPHALLEF